MYICNQVELVMDLGMYAYVHTYKHKTTHIFQYRTYIYIVEVVMHVILETTPLKYLGHTQLHKSSTKITFLSQTIIFEKTDVGILNFCWTRRGQPISLYVTRSLTQCYGFWHE